MRVEGPTYSKVHRALLHSELIVYWAAFFYLGHRYRRVLDETQIPDAQRALVGRDSALSTSPRAMNYWGIAYTSGWGLGLWLIGPQVLSQWECELTLVGFYLAVKVVHKADQEL